MDLQARKLEFIQEFLKIQREDIVFRLEMILKEETSNIKNEEVKPFSMDEFNRRINTSLLDSKNSKLTENKDLIDETRLWH